MGAAIHDHAWKGDVATAAGGSVRAAEELGWTAAEWSGGERAVARGKKTTMGTEHRSGAGCIQGRGYGRTRRSARDREPRWWWLLAVVNSHVEDNMEEEQWNGGWEVEGRDGRSSKMGEWF
ncbi:arginase [Sesbania bispinosa]|nr:arginase [Sesbania bispinosa]